MTGPKRIWAKAFYDEWFYGGWDDHGKAGGTEYVRADIAADLMAALKWVKANPQAHPENRARVVSDAIEKAAGK